MSGRGGRGGRGRGRGGGGGNSGQINGQSFLKRSAVETGLSGRALEDFLSSGGRSARVLYPPMKWHSSGRMWDGEDDEVQVVMPTTASENTSSTNSNNSLTVIRPETVASNAVLQEGSRKTKRLASTKRTASAVYCMNQQRRIMESFQASFFYVRPTQPVLDVVRYSSKSRQQNQQQQVPIDVLVLNETGSRRDGTVIADNSDSKNSEASGDQQMMMTRQQLPKLATDERYFPPELLVSVLKNPDKKARTSSPSSQGDVASLMKELEEQEAHDVDGPGKRHRSASVAENSKDEDDHIFEDPEEEEEMVDYTTNYYASEDEDGGDGGGRDGEATF